MLRWHLQIDQIKVEKIGLSVIRPKIEIFQLKSRIDSVNTDQTNSTITILQCYRRNKQKHNHQQRYRIPSTVCKSKGSRWYNSVNRCDSLRYFWRNKEKNIDLL